MKTGNLNVRSNLWGNLEWQPLIKDKDLSSPPTPVKGNRYIVAATGSGDWADHTGDIAYYNGSSWEFTTKKEGFICYVEDENILYNYTGAAWAGIAGGGLTESSIDNFTILLANSKLKIADRIELNTFLLAYRLAVANSSTKYNLNDGMSDEFEDETGVDTGGSSNQVYNSTDDYYYNLVTTPEINSDTKLMLHGNGVNNSKEILDSGNTGHVITTGSGAGLSTAQKKFGSTSLLLDGTSNGYLTIPDNADWDLGTSDFTIECWVRFNNTSGYQTFMCRGLTTGDISILFRKDHTHQLDCLVKDSSYTLFGRVTGGSLANTGQWYHIAYVRNGNDFKAYIDGVQIGSTATSSSSVKDTDNRVAIGFDDYSGGGGYYFNGYMDELRISVGVARWTGSSFTLPTAEYTSDSYTKLLLHMNTQDVSPSYNIPRFVNGAKLSTAQKKFGSASMYFDGTDDYIAIPSSADWNYGNGDFTIEFWWRPVSLSGGQYIYFRSQPSGPYGGTGIQLSSGKLSFWHYVTSSYEAYYETTSAPSLNVDTWYHVAFVRYGNTGKFYINGTYEPTSVTNAFSSTPLTDFSNPLYLGAWYQVGVGGPSYMLNGYLDEFRVTKGVAKFTSDFSVPVAEYSDVGATYDMTLKSNSYTAQSTPTQARLVLFEEDVDSTTINTDLLGYVSRDGGTTYTQVTLVDEGYYESTKRILSCSPLDISGQPSGTSMKWKVATANTKRIKLHGSGMSWL